MEDAIRQRIDYLQMHREDLNENGEPLTGADKILLTLRSREPIYFRQPVEVSKCTVKINTDSVDVFLMKDAAHPILRFVFLPPYYNPLILPDFADQIVPNAQNTVQYETRRRELFSVSFGSREGINQAVKVESTFRDVPRFVGYLRTLFPWSHPVEFSWTRLRGMGGTTESDGSDPALTNEMNLKTLYREMDVPFVLDTILASVTQDMKNKILSRPVGRHCGFWATGEDICNLPDTCQILTLNKTTISSEDINAFVKAWISGNGKSLESLTIGLDNRAFIDVAIAFRDIPVLEVIPLDGFYVLAKEHPLERGMLKFEQRRMTNGLFGVLMSILPLNFTIMNLLRMVEEKMELETKLLTDGEPHVKERLMAVEGQLWAAQVMFINGRATLDNYSDHPDTCSPGLDSTFLFGYSNDLDYQTVDGIRGVIKTFMGYYAEFKKYVTFANVRFDLTIAEDILYHSTLDAFDSSVSAHMPDRRLGFQDSTIGSDVATVLRKFLQHWSICGATVLLAIKRNTNYTDLSDVVQTLRKHNIYVYSLGSTEPSGGIDGHFMYEVSSKSNGMYIFNNDTWLGENANQLITYALRNNPYYAENVAVTGQGSVNLPVLSLKDCSINRSVMINVGITVQDNAFTGNFRSMKITLDSPVDFRQYNVTLLQYEGTSWWVSLGFYQTTDYKVILEYDYADGSAGAVEVRMFIDRQVDTWPPYSIRER